MQGATDIAERLLAGEKSALARLISWAENADPRFPEALSVIYPRVGRAARVGITGPPGAGKSTLVNALAALLRERGETGACLAIDPLALTGGALLGDASAWRTARRTPASSSAPWRVRGGRARPARAPSTLRRLDAFASTCS